MISCYQFKNTISRYIDRDVSFRSRKSFEKHMESCPDCKKLYQSILATKQAMNQLPEVTVSDDFLEKLRTKIVADRNARIEASLKKGFFPNRIPSFTYGFAAALLAVLVGFYFFELKPVAKTMQMPPSIVQDRIRRQSNPPLNPHTSTPVAGQGEFASSVHDSDSLDNINEKNTQGHPEFQDKIKTVKQEY
ncbi:MAG: zf-HC2 domain-containing protein [Candidatus Marinimicrobia bacterium]|nr:zf-HC2 domain-containing protein [Candidatus Neomarinimicrobiota bacterium]RKY61549.1 MAG: hypothetical protein DRP96_02860 [Candidatus Neomarinimicrobiota bacterium]